MKFYLLPDVIDKSNVIKYLYLWIVYNFHYRYEQNRGKRHFIESWKTGRTWLNISEDSMSCTWCIDVHSESQKDYCWTSAKVETLKLHESTKAHLKSVATIKVRTQIAKGELTEAKKTVESLNKAVIDKLTILFKSVHALCLAGRPFSDFVWISKLDQAKGLDIGQTYLNANSGKEFAKYIALTELKKIGDSIKASKFVSILSDGSTDCSVREVEIVYARICIEGEIKVRNIKISSKLCFHIYAFLFKQTLFDIQMNAFPVPI